MQNPHTQKIADLMIGSSPSDFSKKGEIRLEKIWDVCELAKKNQFNTKRSDALAEFTKVIEHHINCL